MFIRTYLTSARSQCCTLSTFVLLSQLIEFLIFQFVIPLSNARLIGFVEFSSVRDSIVKRTLAHSSRPRCRDIIAFV